MHHKSNSLKPDLQQNSGHQPNIRKRSFSNIIDLFDEETVTDSRIDSRDDSIEKYYQNNCNLDSKVDDSETDQSKTS